MTVDHWLPIAISLFALALAAINALKPKIDSEFNLCISLLRTSSELWEKYNCPSEEDDYHEKLLLKILNNAEWSFIYINSRLVFMKSDPLTHLEQEVIEPFVRCLNQDNETSQYLRSLIEKHTTSKKTFAALKKGLKRKGIKL
ncbi:hypothetical protein [Asticcacaulis solisilvae]|uniref:hypothetical protein n=1 Tax=Asticcacaulis solisilvae TaxID=1217274 RepID=UPI003FD6E011